jgi:hypothetical protein
MLTSVPTSVAAENDKLEMLSINIRHWRKEKGLSFRFMPVHLWQEVIVLARLLGERRVACVLGVNLEDLKRRMQGGHSPGAHSTVIAPSEPDSPQFIELPGVAVTPQSPPKAVESSASEGSSPGVSRELTTERERPLQSDAARTAVVEITAANGDRMTLRIPVDSFNVSSLIHEFRQARS